MIVMHRTHFIKDVPKEANSEVVVAGFIENIKMLGNAIFIWLRDSTGLIQVTLIKSKASPALLKIGEELGLHDFISVKGKVPEKIVAKLGLELLPESIHVASSAERKLPIDVTGHIDSNLDTRLEHRVIDLRRPQHAAVLKVQSKVVEGMIQFLSGKDYMQMFTPALMETPSESGSEMFPVVYFDKTAYLRQDPQLHRQLAILSGFDRVFEIGPIWRAELSHTPRHLCEHRGCAVETSFIKDEKDTMRLEEQVIIKALKKVEEDCKAELELLGKEITIPKTPFPEITFPEIYDLLKELGKKVAFGEDYDHESEILLAKYVREKYKSDFYFVNRFPFSAKPFYVMRFEEDPQWARSVDLIYKGLELSSGGQREHRYKKIMEQAKEKKMNVENLRWFTDFFRYGAPPHGGFCIGIERVAMQILDVQNVREAAMFPRTPERLTP